MKRREFVGQAGCGLAAFLAAAEGAEALAAGQQAITPPPPQRQRRYKIELEIFEARTDTWCHKKGDKFVYPQDWGKICPWLRGSLNEFVRLLEHGVTLSWIYEKSPYEKVIDPDGVTTEFVRCPDPTSNLVVKIIRTALP